jgi:hypothetical protein
MKSAVYVMRIAASDRDHIFVKLTDQCIDICRFRLKSAKSIRHGADIDTRHQIQMLKTAKR